MELEAAYGCCRGRRLPADGLTAVKVHGKVMNAARQISRRFGWGTGARSALSDCIVRTVSAK